MLIKVIYKRWPPPLRDSIDTPKFKILENRLVVVMHHRSDRDSAADRLTSMRRQRNATFPSRLRPLHVFQPDARIHAGRRRPRLIETRSVSLRLPPRVRGSTRVLGQFRRAPRERLSVAAFERNWIFWRSLAAVVVAASRCTRRHTPKPARRDRTHY